MGKKTFYTERDIEQLLQQGVANLVVNDDIVLTDLAREKAAKSGLTLLEEAGPVAESPSAPLADDLKAKIKATVLARMGDGVPEALLEAIIPKILAELNLDS